MSSPQKPVRSTRTICRSLPRVPGSRFRGKRCLCRLPHHCDARSCLCPPKAISGSMRGAQMADSAVVRRIRFLFDGQRLRDVQTPGAQPPPLRALTYLAHPDTGSHPLISSTSPSNARGTQQSARKRSRVAGTGLCTTRQTRKHTAHLVTAAVWVDGVAAFWRQGRGNARAARL